MQSWKLKKIDALVGSVLCHLLPGANCPGKLARPQRILFIRPGGIGDAVLLAPAIQALRAGFPGGRIDVLAEQRNAGVFSLCPEIDGLWHYDRPWELFDVLRQRYDVVIDTEQWHRLSAVVARLIRSHVKIGFSTNERRRMFSHVVNYRHDRYEMDSFLDLLALQGIAPPSVQVPFLKVPAAATDGVSQFLRQLDGRPFVVLFPGASIAERRWGRTKFRELAAAIALRGRGVVVVGGPEDCEAGNFIVEGLAEGMSLAGKTTLAGSAAILARAQLLISGDSGVLHMAVGLGTPTVSFFGPGIATKWAPRGENHIVLNKEYACSPCTKFGTTPPCPCNARCINEISVAEVLAAISGLLKWTP